MVLAPQPSSDDETSPVAEMLAMLVLFEIKTAAVLEIGSVATEPFEKVPVIAS